MSRRIKQVSDGLALIDDGVERGRLSLDSSEHWIVLTARGDSGHWSSFPMSEDDALHLAGLLVNVFSDDDASDRMIAGMSSGGVRP